MFLLIAGQNTCALNIYGRQRQVSEQKLSLQRCSPSRGCLHINASPTYPVLNICSLNICQATVFSPLECHEHIMSETDRYDCIFPQCQNLLNNNEFIRYSGFNGSNWPDAVTFHDNPSRNSFIPTFIANTIILTLISNNASISIYVCIHGGLQNEFKELQGHSRTWGIQSSEKQRNRNVNRVCWYKNRGKIVEEGKDAEEGVTAV